jgi:hypothetical protein
LLLGLVGEMVLGSTRASQGGAKRLIPAEDEEN